MNYLSDDRVAEIAEIIEAYETQQRDISDGRKDTWDSVRDELRAMGIKGAELAAYVANLRAGIAKHWLMTNDRSKLDRKEAVIDGADEICTIIENASHGRTRVHTRGKADLAPVQTEVQTPHDPATGEIIETIHMAGLAAGLVKLADAGDTDAQAVIAAAKAGPDVMRATAAAILDREAGATNESCGSAEGSAVQTESTLAGQAVMPSPAAGAAEQGTTVCAENDSGRRVVSQPVVEPGPQDTKAPSPSVIAVPGKIVEPVEAIPSLLADEPFIPVGVPIPDQFKRATTDQVGRA